ncbi:MAG TPA: nitroreductase [Acidimicrobiaceae bacterium]|nr:nitroreductase [Acidimicrobiaceae bacterium]
MSRSSSDSRPGITIVSEFGRLVRGRRMPRAYTAEPVDSVVVDEILDLARRGPSAGKTDSLQFLVLNGADVARYWDTTLPVDTRSSFPWPQLLDAPVLVIPWVEPGAYVRRYREADKARTGLGDGQDAWSVPYWWVDGGAAVMTILLAAADADLGALLFGLFEHEDDVRSEFGVPDGFRAIGTISLGHPAPDRPSMSAGRKRPPFDTVVHRGDW